MPPEIIHTPSYRQNGRPGGSPLLNFVKNIGLLFEPGAKRRYWGVPFKRHLLSFLIADLALRRISFIEFYRYVSYYVGGTRPLETDFLYQNLRHLSGSKNYLDVSSPRVVPYFLLRYLSPESATLCNPDAADLAESQRSVGRGSKNTTFLPVRLQELGRSKKYDLITSVSVVEHVAPDQTTEFMNTLLTLLAPGGLCLLTFPCAHSEIIEYRASDPYNTQTFDEKNKAYFFQKYFTSELVEREILPGFDEIVANRIFGEVEKGQYWKYEAGRAAAQSYSSSQDHKIMSHMFSEYRSMAPLPGIGVCCYLLKKAKG
jgi:hypothetical protein